MTLEQGEMKRGLYPEGVQESQAPNPGMEMAR